MEVILILIVEKRITTFPSNNYVGGFIAAHAYSNKQIRMCKNDSCPRILQINPPLRDKHEARMCDHIESICTLSLQSAIQSEF